MSTPPPVPPNLPPRPPGAPPVLPISPPPRARKRISKAVWIPALIVGLFIAGFIGLRAYQLAQFLGKPHAAGPADLFREAAHNIGPRGDTASGNTATARQMAGEMSKLMLEIRTAGFEQAT